MPPSSHKHGTSGRMLLTKGPGFLQNRDWESGVKKLIPPSSNNTHRALTPSPALQMEKLRHRLKNKIQENTVVTPCLVVGIIGPWNFQSQWAGSSCLAPWLDEPDSNQARKPQFTYRSCASASGLAHAQWCFLQQTHECCKHKQTSSVARSKATKDGVAPGLMHTKIQSTSKQSTTGHKPKGAHRGLVHARAVHTEARHAPGQRGTGLFPP